MKKLNSACERLRKLNDSATAIREIDEIKHQANMLEFEVLKVHKIASSAIELAGSPLPSHNLVLLLDDAKALVHAERGVIFICGDDLDNCDIVTSSDHDTINDNRELECIKAISKESLNLNSTLHFSDFQEASAEYNIDMPARLLCRSAIISPLTVDVNGEIYTIGVLYLDSANEENSFTRQDRVIIESFTKIAALTIRNIRLSASLQLSYLETVQALAKTLEAKDPRTIGHSERVADYSERCAKRFKLNKDRQKALYSAALLHDIGKIGIREDILNKPGSLTNAEYEHIKSHPLISEGILHGLTFLSNEFRILSQHHERHDGKGYPRGLKGDDICLEGAILQVADAWDAMVSGRIYRDALDVGEALKELQDNAGTQFRPDVVTEFIQMILEEGILPLDPMIDMKQDDFSGYDN
ncbi:MAG TPA: HD domain-containing phosphohydrolase [bacterium]|jgi:HD-GYP domain-containing protein (c-di-GMP phosphodiesterase class II)